MLKDPKKWNLGIAKLSGFMTYLREPFREDQVKQFHEIVDLLEQGSGENLAHFKIPSDRLRIEVIGAQLVTDFSGRPSIPIYSNEERVDGSYFRSQVHGIANYLHSVGEQKPMNDSNPYAALSDDQLRELMINRRIKPKRVIDSRGEHFIYDRAHAIVELLKHDSPQPVPAVSNTFNIRDSNFVHSSPGAAITQTINVRIEELHDIITRLKELSAGTEILGKDQEQLRIDVETIELQLRGRTPNRSIINSCLESAKRIAENTAGSVLGAAIIIQIKAYLGLP